MTKLYIVYNNTDIYYPNYGVSRNYYYQIYLTREKADNTCKTHTEKNEKEANIVKNQILEENLDYDTNIISQCESIVLEIEEGEAFGEEIYDEESKLENSMILDKCEDYNKQKPTKFYIVYNYFECYNIYFTRERAELAREKIMEKVRNSSLKIYKNRNIKDEDLHKHYFVFEVDEEKIFGDDETIEELRQKHSRII